MKKLLPYLNQETSGFTLSVFRILLGFVLTLQSIYWIITEFIKENIIEPTFLFPFIEGLKPLSDTLMNFGLNGVLLISSFLIMTNKLYRLGLILYLFSFTYLWLLCQGFFNNHYYLISIICFLLLFSKTPFSKIEKIRIPSLYLYSLQTLIVLVYIIAGINKINPYWLVDLQPMTYILTKAGINEGSFFIVIFSYLGLFFDLLIGPFLMMKKTRFFGIIAAILFHLINFIIFLLIGGEIGFFPFLMIATLILFINSDKLEGKILTNNARLLSRQYFNKNIAYVLLIFFFFQIIIPFRHVFFKEHVDYTGIGQRFSWRLKNMYKEPKTSGLIEFTVLTENSDTVSTFNLFNIENANIILTNRQKTNLIYYPNLIPVFTKKLEEHFKKLINNNDFDFIIKGRCEIGFMGRDQQLLFDPDLDLTSIKNYNTNLWLEPLKQKPWEIK